MYRSTFTAILLITLTCSCGQKRADQPAPPGPAEAPAATQTSVEDRLAVAMSEADGVREKLTDHRDAIFESSLRQAESIVCGTWRMLKLQGYDYTGKLLDDALENLSGRQSFLDYKGEWNEGQGAAGRVPVLMSISMAAPTSDAYGGSRWVVGAPRRYRNGLSEDMLRDRCPDLYFSPIPNDSEARKIEQKAFASEIAKSIRRLSVYETRLPDLERDISRALVLEARLRKSQADPVVDAQGSDYAAKALGEYEAFHEKATVTIKQMQQGVPVELLAESSDITDVLGVFESRADLHSEEPATPHH